MSWSRAFDEPIALPNGRVLKTLSDAGHLVTSLPKAKHDRPEWRLAAAMLMQAALFASRCWAKRDFLEASRLRAVPGERRTSCCDPILLVLAAHHDLERVIGQGPL
jgi:hypothetical protein